MPEELIAGRYRLLEPLGRGAMSSVWLAEDEELGRRVAVKTLAPSADRARFEREARAAASLSHPNIAGLYDYGEADGKPYMVLEYLPGGSLEDRLRPGVPLDDEETQRLAGGIAAGLAHAHERGLVHRDLKPANVLFDGEDRPKIADFGIARIGGAGTLTEAGTVLGTATYISPEQASGLPAGPASDVYSFGAMLFRMLTGRLPFVSTNAMELVRMHRDDPPPTVRSVRPDAPATLAAVADASLAKDPAARPAGGAALVAALAGVDLGATAVLAAPLAPEADATQVLRPAAARRRAPAGALATLAALLLAAGGVAAWLATRDGGSSGTPPPTTAPLHLPTVPAGRRTTTTLPTTSAAIVPTTTAPAPRTTTARTTTAHTTTAPTTTAHTTTILPATTATTAPATTIVPPTVPPPTTFPATTTNTAPTTTATATTTATTTFGSTAPPPTTTGP